LSIQNKLVIAVCPGHHTQGIEVNACFKRSSAFSNLFVKSANTADD